MMDRMRLKEIYDNNQENLLITTDQGGPCPCQSSTLMRSSETPPMYRYPVITKITLRALITANAKFRKTAVRV